MMYDKLRLPLSEIQARLFELSLEKGFASEQFIDRYMRSKCASEYDMEYNRLQWMGPEYILEEFSDEHEKRYGIRPVKGEQYSEDVMFWIGYVYRQWHFITGESSKNISAQAPAAIMEKHYGGLHTYCNVELAVDDLKTFAEQRRRKRRPRSGRQNLEIQTGVVYPGMPEYSKTVRQKKRE